MYVVMMTSINKLWGIMYVCVCVQYVCSVCVCVLCLRACVRACVRVCVCVVCVCV